MTQRKLLRGGVEPHELTAEERRKGAETTNAKKRQQRIDAETLALEQLASLRLKAWVKLAALIEADSETVQVAAVKEILDRDLGKPGQSLEVTGADGGPLEVMDARERLASGIAGIAARTRTGEPPS